MIIFKRIDVLFKHYIFCGINFCVDISTTLHPFLLKGYPTNIHLIAFGADLSPLV